MYYLRPASLVGPCRVILPTCSFSSLCIPAHRIALTRAHSTVTHQLAVECEKWHAVSREWHLRRMCSNDVEDAPHVLFICPFPPADSIISIRTLSSHRVGTTSQSEGRVRSPTHLLLPLTGTGDLAASVGRLSVRCLRFGTWFLY